MTIVLSLLVALVGLFIYAIANEKWAKLGLVTFGCGLLAFLLQSSHLLTVVR